MRLWESTSVEEAPDKSFCGWDIHAYHCSHIKTEGKFASCTFPPHPEFHLGEWRCTLGASQNTEGNQTETTRTMFEQSKCPPPRPHHILDQIFARTSQSLFIVYSSVLSSTRSSCGVGGSRDVTGSPFAGLGFYLYPPRNNKLAPRHNKNKK